MPTAKSSAKSNNQEIVALLQQQAQTNALFLSIGDGAIATDEQGHINRINQAALKILGYSEEEVLGKWFPKIIVAVDEAGQRIKYLNRPISRAFLSGGAVSEKMNYVRKDGSIVQVAVTVSPIMLKDHPIGAIEVFRDISHEQEVDRMKTEFIYLASHQLRTPLTAVKTYAHMLNEGYRGKLSPDQTDFMDTMLVSLERMNEIINTLLNVSRIEAGKITVNAVPVNLADTLDELINEQQAAADNKKIVLERICEPNIPDMHTDPLLIKEVCTNLISNAIKYTPANGHIKLGLARSGQKQLISVEDNGYGIPADAQEQLFTKFFRAANILDKEEPGTGLGLYLVKGIADVLKAKLWFESEEGKGTSFYFVITDHTQVVGK